MKIRHFFLILFPFLIIGLHAQPSLDYKLVFADEFDGTELDKTAWWQDDCSRLG